MKHCSPLLFCLLITVVYSCTYEHCTSCRFSWNTQPGAKSSSCCPGTQTVHGCSDSCKNYVLPCYCDEFSYGDNTCESRSGKSCPSQTTADKDGINQNQNSAQVAISQLQQQVTAKGITSTEFFDLIFMQGIDHAYQQDISNLVAFQSLMSQANPPQEPPSGVIASFVFGIFQDMIGALPGVGEAIGYTIEVVNSASQIFMATNNDGSVYYDSIAWKQFLGVQALSLASQQQAITNGLYGYILKFWQHNNIPSVVDSTSSSAYNSLVNLLQKQWDAMPSQSQAYRRFIADFMNSCGPGIQIYCYENKVTWGITQVNNGNALTSELLKLTDNCLEPSTNFKDRQNQPIQMAFFTTGNDGNYHTYLKASSTQPGANFPIYSSDTKITSGISDFFYCLSYGGSNNLNIRFPKIRSNTTNLN